MAFVFVKPFLKMLNNKFKYVNPFILFSSFFDAWNH